MIPTADRDFKIFLIMLAAVVVPTAVTLATVAHPVEFVPTSDNPTPLGYTVSQLFWIVPSSLLLWWFRRHPHYPAFSKSFWITMLIFVVAGVVVLDMILGNTFFDYAYPGSIIGIYLPAYVFGKGWVLNLPFEEATFYVFGALFMLLFYIFGDLYWFGPRDPDQHREDAKNVARLARPHWQAAILGLVIEILAILYNRFISETPGFPGYFTVLNIGFITLVFVFLREIKPFVNWRAMSMSVLAMVLLSLIYEVTLALNYGLWEYHHQWMIGIIIKPWAGLPIEEPILYTYSTVGMVFIYEVLRIHFHKGGSLRETLFGGTP